MKNDQVTPAETAVILQIAEQCLGVAGDLVELGCYRGDTSILLGKLLQQYEKGCQLTEKNNHNHNHECQFSTRNPQANGGLSTESANISTYFPQQTADFSTKRVKFSTNKPNFCTKNAEISTNDDKFSTETGQFSTKCPEVTSDEARKLWIYDSFAGLPTKTREDNSGAGANFQAGKLLVTKREVVEKIRRAGLRNVIIKKAWFDDLTDADLPTEIAFGFLDGDLYESIKTSLKLVAPRLVGQGIMIVHDYNNPELPGSSRAVDEFLRTHPEYKMRVQHTLAILQKTSNSE